jgi:hypothetical protein
MTYFLVRHKKADPFVTKRDPAKQAPLVGHKKARRRLSLLRPWIIQTKPGRCEWLQEL